MSRSKRQLEESRTRWRVIAEHVDAGQSCAEIARFLGVTRQAVHDAVTKARKTWPSDFGVKREAA